MQVRAEKRACFKKLPKILSLNIMRYMYNMLNMQRVEKVNTHFSFPFQLDMSPYMEKNLIPKDKEDVDKEAKSKKEQQTAEEEDEAANVSYEYELIGVTVHTGTAEGGHYYAFIRDRSHRRGGGDRWYSFNDAEVKPFDPAQIAAECFGGEVNSRAYDQVTEKYMDMNIEKTNSAYMLFYERVDKTTEDEAGPSWKREADEEELIGTAAAAMAMSSSSLSEELEEWIWQDNVNFIQDNNVFDHTYFSFMWQMVGNIPNTFQTGQNQEDITLLSAKLATSFFLESFIHAKEKLNIVQWVELLTKQVRLQYFTRSIIFFG